MATRRGRKPDRQRRRLAAELRAQGLSFGEIGLRLGITRQGAQHLTRTRSRAATRPDTAPCDSCGAAAPSGVGRCARCVVADADSPFAERLRVFRLTAGLSQTELAARAGMSGTLVSRYERGRRRPRAAKRATLAAVLGPDLLPPSA
jgi:ribosome-binding protein aMBF1 (putative translation factor)